ncbi:transcriptional regulator [Paenibacillus mucilaginosus 3016]|uniref:Transcriptional regulator n=2 Tax=Paenibacillus mucilaginosus TaxID=61624 RepID=H6NJK3_9BACL|nr:LacI family DNA-binding transcriptional regulator [Paenibacillus mucilaginosus]AFC29683.1 transcriptional regulator [Paenibacillus mucilaginosus 3016]AFH61862.1 transcriptional regulator [Paenibacillus mucilaginosus K02]WFA18360.1 LacI family transcriptional regulator [Paenibacillus mucilaginosus]
MKKVTINDIARAANVAKSTVSKVMNDAPTVSPDTKRRVRAIMKQMNYTPSTIATQLARQSSSTIGMLVDLSRRADFLNHFFYTIIGGIESVAGPLHYELTISNIQSSGPDNFMNRLVRGRKVDGLIMEKSILTREQVDELLQLEFPFVSIGRIADTEGVSSVDIDNALGSGMLTDHLVEQGCRKLAFLGGEPADSIFESRSTGFHRSLKAHGLEGTVSCCEGSAAEGYRLTKELLASGYAPDGIITISNYVAFGVLQALQEANFRVPGDICVATFDDYPLAPYTTPPLTCLHLDTFELGIHAASMLMERIDGSVTGVENRLLLPTLIPRASTQRQRLKE